MSDTPRFLRMHPTDNVVVVATPGGLKAGTPLQQDITLRDGQSLVRGWVRLRVENAGVKQVRLRVPGLRDDQVASLRISGPLVTDSVRRTDDPQVWDVRFVRAVLGETEDMWGAYFKENGKTYVAPKLFLFSGSVSSAFG